MTCNDGTETETFEGTWPTCASNGGRLVIQYSLPNYLDVELPFYPSGDKPQLPEVLSKVSLLQARLPQPLAVYVRCQDKLGGNGVLVQAGAARL